MNFRSILLFSLKARLNISCRSSPSIGLCNNARTIASSKINAACEHILNFNNLLTSVAKRSSHTASNEQIASGIKYIPIDYQPVQFDDVQFDKPVPHKQLLEALEGCRTMEEQMEALCVTLALSSEEIERRTNFCDTISKMLRPFLPGFYIQMYGSTVNGFGFKGCDIDMSFNIKSEQSSDICSLENVDLPDIPLVGEVLSGRVSPTEILQLPAKEKLLFIHTVFLEFYKESTDYQPVFINAHVPIVRFCHDKYNLKCDLAFENSVAFSNTKLLYLFGKLDKRVVPMMMAIRYWAKHVELIGKGFLFNTYTISLLVIFFLQNCNPPILPSAEKILSLTDSLAIDDMYDHSFLNVIGSLPPSENKSTLTQLLQEFFYYYLYFDFTRVIRPFTAKSVPREEFFSTINTKRFKMNSICVQDPMLYSHNVAEFVDYKTCRVFFKLLIKACNMFQDPVPFLNPDAEKWGLIALLEKREHLSYASLGLPKTISLDVQLISKLVTGKPCHEKLSATAQMVTDILEHALLLSCKKLQYSEAFEMLQKHDITSAKHRQILESVGEKVEDDLKYTKPEQRAGRYSRIFKTEKELLMSKVENAEDFKNFNAGNHLVSCIECKAMQNTWHGRSHVTEDDVESSGNVLETEHLISLQVSKQNNLLSDQNSHKNDEKRPFRFLCECYTSNTDASSLRVVLRPLERSVFNPVLGIFLKEFIPKIIASVKNDKS